MRRIASILSILVLVPLAAASGCSGGDPQNNTGGGGGSGGAGGAGGSGGGMAGPSDKLRAAIFVGSCIPDDGIGQWLAEFHTEKSDDPLQNYPVENVSCFKDKANGCQAVQDCLGATFEPAAAACAPMCNGNVFTVCADGVKITADCAKFGGTCSTTEQNCVIEPLGPTCDSSTFMDGCQNGAPLVCTDRETKGPDCAKYGLTCGEGGLGGVACIGSGPMCNVQGTSSLSINFDEGIACNGAKLRACVNGFEHELDCATLGTGFTCQTGASGSFCGLAAECEPGADATCEGNSVVVCNAGKIEKVDCTTLGFTGCNAMFGTCSPSIFDQAMP
jgi:hypothetical protein